MTLPSSGADGQQQRRRTTQPMRAELPGALSADSLAHEALPVELMAALIVGGRPEKIAAGSAVRS